MVTLRTKARKTYLHPDPLAVAPIDVYAAEAAAEPTRFDLHTACFAEILRSTQEARSVHIRPQIIKNEPESLRPKLLERFQNTTVEYLCIFAGRLMSRYNL